MEQYTVLENVIMPLFFTPKSGRRSEKEKRALEILKRLEMDEYAHKKVNKLSGGQKQRVAIARALVLNPSLIIADEPTGNLDEVNTKEVLNILKNENEKGRAIIVITHDMKVALNAKRRYRLEEGVLREIT